MAYTVHVCVGKYGQWSTVYRKHEMTDSVSVIVYVTCGKQNAWCRRLCLESGGFFCTTFTGKFTGITS